MCLACLARTHSYPEASDKLTIPAIQHPGNDRDMVVMEKLPDELIAHIFECMIRYVTLFRTLLTFIRPWAI